MDDHVAVEAAKTIPGLSIGSVSVPSGAINAIRIGYARVSTRAQDHLSQMEALAGAHCREVVEETAGTRKDRPKLTATVQRLQPGDTLLIYKPDRVARSAKMLLVFQSCSRSGKSLPRGSGEVGRLTPGPGRHGFSLSASRTSWRWMRTSKERAAARSASG
ncbi:recombinase family protein [Streptosporangium canum]|uniref:recombinase family protein n=1 Tax=Streptosporangium canum TaxID=324952 RepID=UPI00342ADED0